MAKRRANGQKAVALAIKTGELPPAHYLLCFDCDKQAQCYDHRDYRKPLDVWPVCKSCDSKRGPGAPYLRLSRQRVYQIARDYGATA